MNTRLRMAALGVGSPAAPEREPVAEEGTRVPSSADGGRHDPAELDPSYNSYAPGSQNMNERIADAVYYR